MWLSNKYLRECEKLREAGYKPKISTGMILTRGFADIGNEAFCVLPDRRCVSLLSGSVSEISVEEQEHLAHAPRCDEVVNVLAEKGAVVEGLVYIDQREWQLTQHFEGAKQVFLAPTLREVFLSALKATCGVSE